MKEINLDQEQIDELVLEIGYKLKDPWKSEEMIRAALKFEKNVLPLPFVDTKKMEIIRSETFEESLHRYYNNVDSYGEDQAVIRKCIKNAKTKEEIVEIYHDMINPIIEKVGMLDENYLAIRRMAEIFFQIE